MSSSQTWMFASGNSWLSWDFAVSPFAGERTAMMRVLRLRARTWRAASKPRPVLLPVIMPTSPVKFVLAGAGVGVRKSWRRIKARKPAGWGERPGMIELVKLKLTSEQRDSSEDDRDCLQGPDVRAKGVELHLTLSKKQNYDSYDVVCHRQSFALIRIRMSNADIRGEQLNYKGAHFTFI